MSELQDQVIRWEPLPNMPQLPLARVSGVFEGDTLRVVAEYACRDQNTKIEIQFSAVESFELSEEFSDRMLTIRAPLPRLANPDFPTYTWPFLEVQNSKWIAEIVARNGAIEGSDYRHLIVLTLDSTLHVMTCGQLKAQQSKF